MAGLYIHIPFCHSKCLYCDFYSTADNSLCDQLIDTIIREFGIRRQEISEPFKTIYIGGGTPSILKPDQLSRLCEVLPVGDAEEFTLEANPEDITPEIVKSWKRLGINRVSMGIQSFDDTQLRSVGRRHTAATALLAIDAIRSNGIDNINCDLIYGLPGQTFESWCNSLSTLIGCRPQHISAYCLSYEPGTPLHRLLDKGRITPVDDDTLIADYNHLCRATSEAGYEHYEISNFALKGFRSRHNSSYWNNTPYLGLGPGAHSFDGTFRRINPPSVKTYISDCPVAVIDDENEDQRFNDILITALRTSNGLDLLSLDSFRRTRLMKDADKYIRSGAMTFSDNHLSIDETHWLVADSILRDLIQV